MGKGPLSDSNKGCIGPGIGRYNNDKTSTSHTTFGGPGVRIFESKIDRPMCAPSFMKQTPGPGTYTDGLEKHAFTETEHVVKDETLREVGAHICKWGMAERDCNVEHDSLSPRGD